MRVYGLYAETKIKITTATRRRRKRVSIKAHTGKRKSSRIKRQNMCKICLMFFEMKQKKHLYIYKKRWRNKQRVKHKHTHTHPIRMAKEKNNLPTTCIYRVSTAPILQLQKHMGRELSPKKGAQPHSRKGRRRFENQQNREKERKKRAMKNEAAIKDNKAPNKDPAKLWLSKCILNSSSSTHKIAFFSFSRVWISLSLSLILWTHSHSILEAGFRVSLSCFVRTIWCAYLSFCSFLSETLFDGDFLNFFGYYLICHSQVCESFLRRMPEKQQQTMHLNCDVHTTWNVSHLPTHYFFLFNTYFFFLHYATFFVGILCSASFRYTFSERERESGSEWIGLENQNMSLQEQQHQQQQQ